MPNKLEPMIISYNVEIKNQSVIANRAELADEMQSAIRYIMGEAEKLGVKLAAREIRVIAAEQFDGKTVHNYLTVETLTKAPGWKKEIEFN